jgi:hypothetical protein
MCLRGAGENWAPPAWGNEVQLSLSGATEWRAEMVSIGS